MRKIFICLSCATLILLLTCVHLVWSANMVTPKIGVGKVSKIKLSEYYLPIRFEQNKGQADKDVKFISRGNNYNLFLTPYEALIFFQSSLIHTKLIGSNKRPKIIGLNKLPGRVNYFFGNDPKKWQRDIPIYSKVKYEDIYPGIDLVFYGKDGLLEYDFVLSPGANPKNIKLAFHGADRIENDNNDNLVLYAGAEKLTLKKPLVYQEVNKVKQEVKGNYIVVSNQVGFQIAKYDVTKPLIIDPAFVFSTYLGGESGDEGNDIITDNSGNVYIIGHTTSDNFPTKNAKQGSLGAKEIGEEDAFITKLSPSGELIFSTFLGGSKTEIGNAIDLDSQGNIFVGGYTNSTDFPTLNSLYSSDVAKVSNNGFLTKLTPDGSSIVYSTYFGGSISGVAIDKIVGSVYVTGTTSAFEKNFPTTPGAFGNDAGVFTSDCFVAKIDSQGSSVVYSTLIVNNEKKDEPGETFCNGIAIDPSGNAYVTGNTQNKTFPVTGSVFQTMITPSGETCFGNICEEAFVTKLNADGSMLVYSTFLGGSHIDRGRGIKLDANLNAYIAGETLSSDFPTTDGVIKKTKETGGENTNQPPFDAFITKLDTNGSMLIYSTFLGGSSKDLGNSLAIDVSGNVYVTGLTQSNDFPIKEAIQNMHGGGVDDVFVTKINPDATNIVFSTYVGGGGIDEGTAIAIDPTNKIYVTGTAGDPEHFIASSGPQPGFPTTPGALQPFFRGGIDDAFVLKIDESLTAPPVSSSGGATTSSSSGGVSKAELIMSYTDSLDSLLNAYFDLEEEIGVATFGSQFGELLTKVVNNMKSAVTQKPRQCEKGVQEGIKFLRVFLNHIREKVCTKKEELKNQVGCIKKSVFDRLFPPINNAFRSIKLTSRTDSNNNHKPGICEKEK